MERRPRNKLPSTTELLYATPYDLSEVKRRLNHDKERQQEYYSVVTTLRYYYQVILCACHLYQVLNNGCLLLFVITIAILVRMSWRDVERNTAETDVILACRHTKPITMNPDNKPPKNCLNTEHLPDVTIPLSSNHRALLSYDTSETS